MGFVIVDTKLVRLLPLQFFGLVSIKIIILKFLIIFDFDFWTFDKSLNCFLCSFSVYCKFKFLVIDMNNKNELIKETIYGLLTVEPQPLSAIIEIAGDLLGVKPVTVNFSINKLVEDGVVAKEVVDDVKVVRALNAPVSEEVPVVEVSEVIETPIVEVPTVEAKPVKKVAKWGTTTQLDKTGKEFQYVRKEFDGHEGKLSPAHEAKKRDIVVYKSVIRKLVKNCNGIGPVAITMYEPEVSTRDDGKVFYRWDNPSKTEPLIDRLHALIEPMIEAMKEGSEQ